MDFQELRFPLTFDEFRGSSLSLKFVSQERGCVPPALDWGHRCAVYILARRTDVLIQRLLWRQRPNQLIKQFPLDGMLLSLLILSANTVSQFRESNTIRRIRKESDAPWVKSQLFNCLGQFPLWLVVIDGVAVVCSSPRYRVVRDIGEQNHGRCFRSRHPLLPEQVTMSSAQRG